MHFRQLLRSLLLGIFLIGYCIGAGRVTAMATAGAEVGMSLLWTVFLSCLIAFFLIDLYGKFTLVTGETTLVTFRTSIPQWDTSSSSHAPRTSAAASSA